MRKVYPYKTMTEKLANAFEHIESSGHEVIHIQHMGGRDWLLIVRGSERADG